MQRWSPPRPRLPTMASHSTQGNLEQIPEPTRSLSASGQCCRAFKDQQAMWGQRSQLATVAPTPAQVRPFVTLGFYLCTSYPMAILAGRLGTPKSLQFWVLQK